MSKSKYRSLFADSMPRHNSRTARHAPLKRSPALGPSTIPSTSARSSSSSLNSLTARPPAYVQPFRERSEKTARIYPKPEGDQVLSVTIRLRGDCHGEILTTTATFHAYDGLQNQIQACLFKNFGKGAIGIATPRGKVITEDWQIYQLTYPGFSSSICNVVYAREDQKNHPDIVVQAAKLLLEVKRKDFNSARPNMFLYLDPNESYATSYIDQPGLSIVPRAEVGLQENLAIQKGYYYTDTRGLPSYDEISLFAFGRACLSIDCGCCQGWMRSKNDPDLQRSRREGPRWRGVELQDYDGLTLEERKYLLGSGK